jgi:hypothetical protein
MAELTPGMLLQQQELLREIRDELRSTRMSAGSGGSPGSGAGSLPARPSSSYISARATMDRMLAGEWGSLGWSGAYAPVFKSGLTQDILSSMGLIRAPNTLTQLEFQMMSHDMLGARMAGMATNLIAPGFAGRSRTMAETLYANAGRFARFGDAGTGPLGAGIGYSAAFDVARSLQMGAATDLRMSGRDYNTVMSTGMNTGQFDFSTSVSDLKDRFNELKNAVADLSRTTRMSTEEVAKSMGALRQYGVYDVADQKRMVSQMGATAAVAGLSMGEVSGAVQTAMQRGLQLGIGPQAGFQLAQTNIAAMRTMTRGGIVSDAVRAMGGGVGAIAENITSAQQNFLGSDVGYLAIQGGGGDFLGAMGRGLGQNGTLGGFLGARARRMDRMSQVTGDEAGALMDSFVDTQMRLSGINSYDTDEGQGALMTFAGQLGMSDPAALSYARGRSRRGVRARLATELNTASATRRQAGMLAMDEAYMYESFGGNLQRGMAGVRGLVAGGANAVMDWFSPGAGGAFGMEGSFQTRSRAISAGASPDVLTPELIAAMGSANPASRQLAFAPTNSQGIGRSIGGAIGGLVGGGAGWLGMAAAGALLLNPIGLGVTALTLGIGAAAGAAVGGYYGMGVGGGVQAAMGMDAPKAMPANEASSYFSVRTALEGAQAGTAGANTLMDRMNGDPSFMKLVNLAAKGDLDPEDSKTFISGVQSLAAKYQVSDNQVASALKTVGAAPALAKTYELGAWKQSDLGEAHTAAVAGLSGNAGDILGSSGAKFAVAGLATAVRTGDNAAILKGRATLSGMGVSDKDLARLVSNIEGMGEQAGALSANYREQAMTMGRRSLNEQLAAVGGRISELVGGDDTARKALEKFGGNSAAMVEALSAGGSETAPIMAALRRSDTGRMIADIASISGQESADELSMRFHGTKDDGSFARLKSITGGNKQAMIQALYAGTFKGPEEDKEKKSAILIKQASDTLKALAGRLGISIEEGK